MLLCSTAATGQEDRVLSVDLADIARLGSTAQFQGTFSTLKN
jgi:hypothetical protein